MSHCCFSHHGDGGGRRSACGQDGRTDGIGIGATTKLLATRCMCAAVAVAMAVIVLVSIRFLFAASISSPPTLPLYPFSFGPFFWCWPHSLARFAGWVRFLGLPLLFMQLSAVFAARSSQVFPAPPLSTLDILDTLSPPDGFSSQYISVFRSLVCVCVWGGVCFVSLCDFHICCHFELFQWLLTGSRLARRRLPQSSHAPSSRPHQHCFPPRLVSGEIRGVYIRIILFSQSTKSSTVSDSIDFLRLSANCFLCLKLMEARCWLVDNFLRFWQRIKKQCDSRGIWRLLNSFNWLKISFKIF